MTPVYILHINGQPSQVVQESWVTYDPLMIFYQLPLVLSTLVFAITISIVVPVAPI